MSSSKDPISQSPEATPSANSQSTPQVNASPESESSAGTSMQDTQNHSAPALSTKPTIPVSEPKLEPKPELKAKPKETTHRATAAPSSQPVPPVAPSSPKPPVQPPAQPTAMQQSADQPPAQLSTQASAPPLAAPSSTEQPAPADAGAIARNQPIPPASEPMQYRAIGLTRGIYKPSDEQFTKGNLITEDGIEMDAVLLGRVMSLVRKHLDLEVPHLWVVYPRTRNKDTGLHLQIVGVWEPEKLNQPAPEELDAESNDADAAEEGQEMTEELAVEADATTAAGSATGDEVSSSQDEPQNGYFSIRGEVIYHSPEEERLIVKIQQAPRKGAKYGKAFQLRLQGNVEGKSVGYFWDLNVQLEGQELVIQDGSMIAFVPPKKRTSKHKPSRRPGGGGGGGKFSKKPQRPRGEFSKPTHGSGDRPSSSTPRPISKPVPRPNKERSSNPNPPSSNN